MRLRKRIMSSGTSRFDITGQLGAMRRYARSLTRDDVQAEDLVHDAFVRAYEKRESFRESGNLRAWLLSILHNVFIDGRRARQAENLRIEKAAELTEPHLAPVQDHQLRLNQVRRAFMALPEEQRTALHLVAVEGMSFSEAADALGIPSGTLMSRLARARAALRAMEDAPGTRTDDDAPSHLRIVGGSNESSR